MTRRLFNLDGDVIVVSGGCGLIGESVCEALDEHGADVIVADVDDERGPSIADSLSNGSYVELDITDEESVVDLCDTLEATHGRVDGLVNTAYPRGSNYGQAFESVSPGDWQENVNLHLGGYYTVTREVALRMLDDGNSGSIVNFASIYGMQAPDFSIYDGLDVTSPVEYSAIKGAILNLTRYLASYLGSDGIRVNAVSPGGVFDGQAEQFVERYEQKVPLSRMARPEDVLGAVVFLLSDASAYVTGHNLVVDGGWSIS